MRPPETDFSLQVGEAKQLQPGLRCVLAPNPSPMTHWGTNTYLLGHKELVVIDPGPDDTGHLNAILKAVGSDQTIAKIIVTHTHKDHSPLARRLSAQTGAEIYGFGDADAGRSAVMRQLSLQGDIGGGEGIDLLFQAHHEVSHHQEIDCELAPLKVLHTPGHIGNHICLSWDEVCFTGDHVMGWASSLVSPPDGDLTDFMASCDMLQGGKWLKFYSGHGAPIDNPGDRLNWLISHRKSRENQIVKALENRQANAAQLTAQIYHDINPALLRAAERNVLAHLVDLYKRGRVAPHQTLESKAIFQLI
ncbi:MBL fold metallo-hydrolase [Cognatishimia sp. WU-CL00825]|uniref:MBL fold metallo-hydrolase n=1 Tax=Cognatishimia sp. WU-CL00825 TaxID=3127658 RepID=UPI0031032171